MIAGSADGRRVAALGVVALAAVALAAFGMAGWWRTFSAPDEPTAAGRGDVAAGDRSPEPGSTAGSQSVEVAAGSEATSTASVLAGEGVAREAARGDGVEPAGGVAPVDLEGARATAAAFAVGWSTYRFDEPATAALERVRPLMSAEAAAALGARSGASAEQERRAARHEVVEAAVDAVITSGFDATHALLSVVTSERVQDDGGVVQRSVVYDIALVHDGTRWLVTSVTGA
jgi:hypothetical protein